MNNMSDSVLSASEVEQAELVMRRDFLQQKKRKMDILENLQAVRQKRRKLEEGQIDRLMEKLEKDSVLLEEMKRAALNETGWKNH